MEVVLVEVELLLEVLVVLVEVELPAGTSSSVTS